MRRRKRYHAPINKAPLTEAFKELRKKGYFTRQNFWCCQSCAWSDVPEKAEKVVFYHNQDNQNLLESGSCYLAWKGNGKEIVDVLTSHGVAVNWDGDEHTRIEISLKG